MRTKALLESRTFWVAVAQSLAGAYLVFAAAYPGLETVGFVFMAKSLLDVFLRLQTSAPIEGVVK